ncbi:hypothetical protein Taro_026848 [Colocasia esculenta]|uniref:Uncharacterized protein n=1 Tax=Colocasia esculenta TaxID=4460 RepID=A0A843V768_COLES|nr:hypothetical protein [Colocasia esculenta]
MDDHYIGIRAGLISVVAVAVYPVPLLLGCSCRSRKIPPTRSSLCRALLLYSVCVCARHVRPAGSCADGRCSSLAASTHVAPPQACSPLCRTLHATAPCCLLARRRSYTVLDAVHPAPLLSSEVVPTTHPSDRPSSAPVAAPVCCSGCCGTTLLWLLLLRLAHAKLLPPHAKPRSVRQHAACCCRSPAPPLSCGQNPQILLRSSTKEKLSSPNGQ